MITSVKAATMPPFHCSFIGSYFLQPCLLQRMIIRSNKDMAKCLYVQNERKQPISHGDWLFQEVSYVATSSLKISVKKVGSSMFLILHSLYGLKLDDFGVKLPCSMLHLPGPAVNPSSC